MLLKPGHLLLVFQADGTWDEVGGAVPAAAAASLGDGAPRALPHSEPALVVMLLLWVLVGSLLLVLIAVVMVMVMYLNEGQIVMMQAHGK